MFSFQTRLAPWSTLRRHAKLRRKCLDSPKENPKERRTISPRYDANMHTYNLLDVSSTDGNDLLFLASLAVVEGFDNLLVIEESLKTLEHTNVVRVIILSTRIL